MFITAVPTRNGVTNETEESAWDGHIVHQPS